MDRGPDELSNQGGLIRRSLASIDQAAVDALRGRFFAVPPDAPRSRRPTDVTVLILSSVILLVFALRAGSPAGPLERALISLFEAFPGFLDPLWSIVHDFQVVWVFILVVVAAWRRQWRMLASTVGAIVLVQAVGAVFGRLVNDEWPELFSGLFHIRDKVPFPALGLAAWVASVSVASAYLSRPYRFFGRSVLTAAGLASVVLGATTPSDTVGAFALGLACASAIHLLTGSPGGVPSLDAVRQVLMSTGIEATPHAVERSRGVVLARAIGADGSDLDVKIYGRDAWDSQLLVKLWKFFWYRESGAPLALSRLQQVEHEAFLTLLAERQGVPVDYVVAADKNVIGDAVLVVRRDGPLLAETTQFIDDRQLHAMWSALADLHRIRIAHGAVDPVHLRVRGTDMGLADLSSGFMASGATQFLVDRAQLFVTTALTAGPERAVAVARAALGDDEFAEVTSFVQPAALTSELRRRCNESNVDVDELRAAAVTTLGLERRDLQKLRRISLGGVITSLVLFVAGYVLVSQLTQVGIDTIVDAMRDASLAVLVGAFLVSSFGRFMAAVGLSGISPTPVPLGRLTMLQFAQSFVNLAMPSTAGRVAINIRFFQRNGVEPTTAVAMGALDGFTGFLCQIVIFGSILLFGIGSLDLNLSVDFDFATVQTLLVWLGVILVIGIAVIWFVPVLRNWVIDKFKKVRGFLMPFLRSPRRLGIAFGANFLSELIGALTLFTVLSAFGQSVNYLDVVLVSITVSLFAGLMPVPGGIGVTEAALTAGFIALGVPDATAFAAALTCRMITSYLPPFLGVFAFRWLRKQGFL